MGSIGQRDLRQLLACETIFLHMAHRVLRCPVDRRRGVERGNPLRSTIEPCRAGEPGTLRAGTCGGFVDGTKADDVPRLAGAHRGGSGHHCAQLGGDFTTAGVPGRANPQRIDQLVGTDRREAEVSRRPSRVGGHAVDLPDRPTRLPSASRTASSVNNNGWRVDLECQSATARSR